MGERNSWLEDEGEEVGTMKARKEGEIEEIGKEGVGKGRKKREIRIGKWEGRKDIVRKREREGKGKK